VPIDDGGGRIPRSQQRHAVSVPIPTVPPDAVQPQLMYADLPPMNMQIALTDPQVRCCVESYQSSLVAMVCAYSKQCMQC